MATNLFPTKRNQQYLILIAALAVILILVLIWQNLLKKPPTSPEVAPVLFPTTIKINWAVLQGDELTGLQPFAGIPPFEDTVGRENPFEPY
jgi:uncharacterized integral membrane protein